jgi:hypothetical protein
MDVPKRWNLDSAAAFAKQAFVKELANDKDQVHIRQNSTLSLR